MNYYGYTVFREEDLMHYGIPGMKWGVRRFQNEDGSLTSAGRVRDAKKQWKQASKEYRKVARKNNFGMGMIKARDKKNQAALKVNSTYDSYLQAKVDRAKERKGDKGERREYLRQAHRIGLPGSGLDAMTGYAGSRLYNRMTVKKGQEYADSVMRTTRNRLIAEIAGGYAVAAGLMYLSQRV